MNVMAAALGRYPIRAPYSHFDCVIGNSFGTSINKGSVNSEILMHAEAASASGEGCPLIVDRTLADAYFQKGTPLIDHIVEGPVSNARGEGIGTWGVLESALAYMNRRWPREPRNQPLVALLVGQHFHVGRIALQARKLGMDPQIPVGLPRSFDHHSRQIWTRNLAFWLPREIIGSFVLSKKGQL